MEFLLNEQQVLLRDAAAKLGASKGGPRRARTLRDARPAIDADAWKRDSRGRLAVRRWFPKSAAGWDSGFSISRWRWRRSASRW